MPLIRAVCHSRRNPPLQVISDLIHYDRNATSTRNEKGQTPLHIAVANRTSFEVIEHLTNEFPEATEMRDHDGKIPLMIFCESYFSINHKDMTPTEKEDEFIDLLDILLNASIHSIVIEDKNGRTALEYAIMNDAGLQAIKMLQEKSKMYYDKICKDFELVNSGKELYNFSSSKTRFYKM